MATSKTIINTRKANLTAAGVTLRPGENVMDEEKARGLIANGQAKVWRGLGWIRVKPADRALTLEQELDAGTGGDDTAPPGPMSAKETINRVASESDVYALEAMLGDESRVTVVAAIKRRLDELSPGPDGAGEGDAGSDDAPGDDEG